MNLENLKTRLAALDPAELAAPIDTAEAEMRRLAEAEDRGRARLAEIQVELRALDEGSIDAGAAAMALLDGDAIAPPSRDALLGERSTLEAGLRELRRRQDDAAAERDRARSEALGCLAEAAGTGEADAALEQARDLLGTVAAVYASANAIADATGASAHREVADVLREVIATAGRAGLLPRMSIGVPVETVGALEAGRAAISAARRSITLAVSMPSPAADQATAFAIAAMANRRAA